jgi:hypothetical protein
VGVISFCHNTLSTRGKSLAGVFSINIFKTRAKTIYIFLVEKLGREVDLSKTEEKCETNLGSLWTLDCDQPDSG